WNRTECCACWRGNQPGKIRPACLPKWIAKIEAHAQDGAPEEVCAASTRGTAMTRIAPAVVRYGLSILAVAAVVGFNFAIGLREHFSTPFFLAAVAGCAWYGGLGCGLLATIASALALDYFFVGKEFAFDFDATTWVWLLVFMAVAIFLNILAESQRRLLATQRVEDQRKTQF